MNSACENDNPTRTDPSCLAAAQQPFQHEKRPSAGTLPPVELLWNVLLLSPSARIAISKAFRTPVILASANPAPQRCPT